MSRNEDSLSTRPGRFLKRKSEAVFKQMESIHRLATTEALRSMDQVDLTLRLELIDNIRNNFELTQNRLEEEDPDELDSDARQQFMTIFMSVKGDITRELQSNRMDSHLHSTTRTFSPQDSQSVVVLKQPKSCLPELKLPTFTGNYSDWPHFFSMFRTVIDREAELTKVEKLQHLRSCLADAALDTIKSLEIRESNYDKALELLSNRFDNKRLIFQAHIRELFGLESVEAKGAANLRRLTDKFLSHIRALQTLGGIEQLADGLLIHIVMQKLDSATQNMWEEKVSSNELPTWKDMALFLEKRCQTLENVAFATLGKAPTKQVSKNMYRNKSFVVSKPAQRSCVFCKHHDHLIYNCPSFVKLSPSERWKEAKNSELCLNCLKLGHRLQQCKSTHCFRCKAAHHTLLHKDTPEQPIQNVSSAETFTQTKSAASLVSVAPACTSKENASIQLNESVLLATATVFVKNRVGCFIPCRAILDSASQLNFATSRLSSQLQLKKSKFPVVVSGIGDSGTTVEYTINITFKSIHSDYTNTITASIIPTITERQPNTTFSISQWIIPENIKLADPSFNTSRRIDLLIGASVFFDLLCVGQIRLKEPTHILQKTRLGWIVSGGKQRCNISSSCAMASKLVEGNEPHESLDQMVRGFWETENCVEGTTKVTKEELDCEIHFQTTHCRLVTGEYSVRLPVKLSPNILGDSYQHALRRLISLERRLQKNDNVRLRYSAFMREYLDLKHMSLVVSLPNVPTYYLPHHCVFKEDSTTTKLRVVFDGSASTTSNYSLNEILMAGPTIQPKLAETLIRFRSKPIALTGDICKMYRCVRITSPDDYLQCILWRENPLENVKTYKLETVTYGTRPASFLAIRAMHQLAKDEAESYPLGAQILLRDFYVDDMITGSDTAEEAIEIMGQTSQLLAKGNFKIRKWCSNDQTVLAQIPLADREKLLKFDDGSSITKALGLQWNTDQDLFFFAFTPFQRPTKITKRSALSIIARLYDPLGLVGPFVLKAKIFLQRLWMEKLDWDESLPMSHETSWENLCSQFDSVKHLAFPRFIAKRNASLELHAFCDASLSAYGTCIYIRASSGESVHTNLLCSKSRVAPIKSLTVPKLELCAAYLLAQVVHSIAQLNIFKCMFYCWSDSSIVLSWLKEDSSRFNVFVANRINSIQNLTEGMEWRYVPTAVNPADILSRGATPIELLKSSLWKHGPPFLCNPYNKWPKCCVQNQELPETRKTFLLSTRTASDMSINCKYINSFASMQRIYAYVYKFVKKDNSGQLTPSLIQNGTYFLIRMIQMVHFSAEYTSLQRKDTISSKSALFSLSPFLDAVGLLRVGGRLKNTILDFESRHPIIMPKHHPLTISMINYFHLKNLHVGPQALLATIRLQYWPIGGRKSVAQVLNKCIICFRAKPRLMEQIMADLPMERVQAARSFSTTGIDFCGPFYYQSEIRNKQPLKCYIALFICFATKAVHLELVKDLSTPAFLAALQRFISTRGKPKTIWTDNATNFVGAKNELLELRRLFLSSEHQSKVAKQCAEDGIEWKFIPPRSPHFGGLWEAAVKSAKFHFYRVVCSSRLSFEELRTLVSQISAVINSRPLIPLTEHPDDLAALTPGHFLIGGPFTAIVEPDITDLSINRLSRWQRISQMQQIFWKRWSTEYLTQLQQRSKWRTHREGLKTGALVLMKEENLPPLRWPLARVIDLIPGSDGVARVANLKTSSGITKRAITRLCLLPLDDRLESLNFQRAEDVGNRCNK